MPDRFTYTDRREGLTYAFYDSARRLHRDPRDGDWKPFDPAFLAPLETPLPGRAFIHHREGEIPAGLPTCHMQIFEPTPEGPRKVDEGVNAGDDGMIGGGVRVTINATR